METVFNILMADDDPLVHQTSEMEFEKCSEFNLHYVNSGEEAIAEFRQNPTKYALAVLDYHFGDDCLDGATTARELKKINPDQFVITYSGDDSRKALKDTFKAGVSEFLEKTVDTEKKIEIFKEYCIQYRKHHEAIKPDTLRKKYQEEIKKVGMVGCSKVMADTSENIQQFAKVDSNVLIRGESGTGKELVAKAIHFLSDRKQAPYITVNCGAIPENLIESKLFGHSRGSFTGATSDCVGYFEQAHGGTIFLDEIGDLPLSMQVKLLRVLQEGEIEPIGKKAKKVNVKILAATHVNLEQRIKEKQFREDLYFRLNVLSLELPPLRERKEDIDPLLLHFSNEILEGKKIITSAAAELLKEYDWYGNVRQLRNAIERLNATTGRELKIKASHLDKNFFNAISIDKCSVNIGSTKISCHEELKDYVANIEKSFWVKMLKESNSTNELSKKVKISKNSLYRKFTALGINYKMA